MYGIAINDIDFRSTLIAHFTDRDRDQFGPCFTDSERIKQIIAFAENSDNLAASLKLMIKSQLELICI